MFRSVTTLPYPKSIRTKTPVIIPDVNLEKQLKTKLDRSQCKTDIIVGCSNVDG